MRCEWHWRESPLPLCRPCPSQPRPCCLHQPHRLHRCWGMGSPRTGRTRRSGSSSVVRLHCSRGGHEGPPSWTALSNERRSSIAHLEPRDHRTAQQGSCTRLWHSASALVRSTRQASPRERAATECYTRSPAHRQDRLRSLWKAAVQGVEVLAAAPPEREMAESAAWGGHHQLCTRMRTAAATAAPAAHEAGTQRHPRESSGTRTRLKTSGSALEHRGWRSRWCRTGS